jgi:hypothetical protein
MIEMYASKISCKCIYAFLCGIHFCALTFTIMECMFYQLNWVGLENGSKFRQSLFFYCKPGDFLDLLLRDFVLTPSSLSFDGLLSFTNCSSEDSLRPLLILVLLSWNQFVVYEISDELVSKLSPI